MNPDFVYIYVVYLNYLVAILVLVFEVFEMCITKNIMKLSCINKLCIYGLTKVVLCDAQREKSKCTLDLT